MRALIQRVTSASVTVADETVGEIGAGYLALIGVTHDDDEAKAKKLADRIAGLRIMDDEDGVMNKSVVDVGAEVLVVSQFTLYGDASKGRRPTWAAAAKPEVAEPLIETLIAELRERGLTVATGRFRADMAVALVNDGPSTLMLEVT